LCSLMGYSEVVADILLAHRGVGTGTGHWRFLWRTSFFCLMELSMEALTFPPSWDYRFGSVNGHQSKSLSGGVSHRGYSGRRVATMSAKQFRYYDNWKTEVLTCPKCGWSGTFDQGSVDYHDEVMDSSCPVCPWPNDPMLAIVSGSTRSASKRITAGATTTEGRATSTRPSPTSPKLSGSTRSKPTLIMAGRLLTA